MDRRAPYLLNPPDVHELLKRDVFGDSCPDHFEKSKPCPTEPFGVSDQYMVLDSWVVAAPVDWRRGTFVFHVAPPNAYDDRRIGVHDTLDTITEVEVAESYMGLPSFVDVDAPGNSDGLFTLVAAPAAGVERGTNPRGAADPLTRNTQLPFGRVTVHFKELGLQSYHDRGRRQHTFEFDVALVGASVDDANARMKITPVEGVYTLTSPIREIQSLTLQFLSPDVPVSLQPDSVRGVSFAVGAAGELRVHAPEYLEDSSPVDFARSPRLLAGDRVYFEGVSFADPALGLLQAYLLKADGHFVGARAGLGAQEFQLDPTVTVVPAALHNTTLATSAPVVLRIAKNRMRVPMRVRRIVPHLTNYIAP